ncbi:hypothetical protein T484DRAFT_3645261, partial [Baffinella frigidus]
GFRVSGFGFRVSGFGFRVSGFGFRVFGFQVSGSGFRFGFRISDFGFRVWDGGTFRRVVGADPRGRVLVRFVNRGAQRHPRRLLQAFRVSGFGCGVWCLGFGVWGLGCGMWGVGFEV